MTVTIAPVLLPAIWLIVLIAGLSQLSETVYTPSLPDIARALNASESMVEYTLTIYLLGFALGTLFWGKISDGLGRKPCVISGLIIFIVGCIGCYFSRSIEMLMVSRLVQAFGGSIGSVLSQAMCRDVFHGPALVRVYSTVGTALAVCPAFGPMCGGLIAQHFGWSNVFVFLTAFAAIVTVLAILNLPETHPRALRNTTSIWNITKRLAQDPHVIGCGLIIGGCNGILFSYFAEGSFYLIKGLNLSPSSYGYSFVPIAAAMMAGNMFSRRLNTLYASKFIMRYGLLGVVSATTVLSVIALIHHSVYPLPNPVMIAATILCQMGCSFGTCMTLTNTLALALVDYKHAIGTASSLFGFFYYGLISVFTFFMGLLHNGTLLPMPLYFLGIAIFMMGVQRVLIRR